MKAVVLRVSGDVQGVFYRHWARETAQKYQVSGWARNEQDGTVLISVQGDDQAVGDYIKWAHQGSPMSTVESVSVSEIDFQPDQEGFQIK